MDAIKLLKLGWKAGIASLMALVVAFAGLFITLNSASATGGPKLALIYLGTNNSDSNDPLDHDVTLSD